MKNIIKYKQWLLAILLPLFLLSSAAVKAADAINNADQKEKTEKLEQEQHKDLILGYWYNEEKSAIIGIYRDIQNDTFFGKIVWLQVPLKDGKAKVDENNPKSELTSKPLNGLKVLNGFKFVKHHTWKHGTIYDPKNGKTYSCILVIKANKIDELRVRGYIGISLLGRTAMWEKVPSDKVKLILKNT